MAAAVNERVAYVAFHRVGEYEAVVRRVNPDGTVALDVYMPGLATSRRGDLEPVIHLRAVSYGPEGRARPLEQV